MPCRSHRSRRELTGGRACEAPAEWLRHFVTAKAKDLRGRRGALATFAALTAIFASQAIATPPLEKSVDQAAKVFLRNPCVVGLSIVVRRGGQTVIFNFGSVSRERRQTPTPDSVYELASVTKTFTGAIAARALLEGQMTLDSDYRSYLGAPYPNLASGGKPITLRALATHSSGLPRDLPDTDALMATQDYEHIGKQLAALNKGFDRSRNLAALHDVTLRSEPGAAFAYSNLGIRVLSYGIEQTYGQSFRALVRRWITNPLKMRETVFKPTPAMRKRLVTPYSRSGSPQPYHDASAGAAYGLYSTPRDMARYLTWQLDERYPVIARSHLPIRGTSSDGEALIWNLGRDGSDPILWHGGGSFGMTSQMLLYPKSNEGYVLLANDACEGSEGALKALAMRVHREMR